MSEMTKILPADNHEFLEGTIALRNQLEEGFLVLAERLKKIRDEQLYTNEYDSFETFLMELAISRSTAYKIIGVFEKFVLLGEIEPGMVASHGWGNLCLFLGQIRTKEEAVAIFNRVSQLTRTDATRELAEMKTGKPQASCEHEWSEVHLRQCAHCKLKEKIYDNA